MCSGKHASIRSYYFLCLLVVATCCLVCSFSFRIIETSRNHRYHHRHHQQQQQPPIIQRTFYCPTVSSIRLQSSSSSSSSSNIPNTILDTIIAKQQRLYKHAAIPDVQVVDAMPPPLLYNNNNNNNTAPTTTTTTTKHWYYLLRHGQSTANVDEVISSDWTALAYTNKHGLTATGYQQGYQLAAAQLLQEMQQNYNNDINDDDDDDDNDDDGGVVQTADPDQLVFVSSPFARARETAQACLDGLLQNETNRQIWQKEWQISIQPTNTTTTNIIIYYHDLLMERYFGRLDNQAIYTYAYVWPLDRINVTHTAFGVESVAAVCTRLRQCIQDLEAITDFDSLLLDKNDNSSSSSSIGDDDGGGRSSSSNNNGQRRKRRRRKRTHVVFVSHADVLQILQLYAAGVPNVGEFSSYRFANGEVRRMHIGTGWANLPPASPLPAPQRGTGM